MRRFVAPITLALMAALLPTGLAHAAICTAALEHPAPDPRPLRFGVTATSKVFSSQIPRFPELLPLNLEALDGLRGPQPLLVRIHRVLYRDGAHEIDRVAALAAAYTDAGHQVTLQVRYGPFGAETLQTGEAFAVWVRALIARVGANPGVVGIEITNEANLTTAPDNSDGAFPNAVDALAFGVIAAADERDARGHDHLKIGFNWFYETGPVDEDAFWRAVAASGGGAFADAVDFVGANIFPGTYDFLATVPGREGEEMVTALTMLRSCYLPLVGIPATTPIRVSENSYPNGFGRGPLMADAMERMVRAVHAHAGALNVTHHVWFTLRDVSSGSLSHESNYGLLDHEYRPKDVYGRYRDLITELG